MSDSPQPREWRFHVEDMLVHGYLGIDDDTVWSIARDDLGPLRAALIALLAARP